MTEEVKIPKWTEERTAQLQTLAEGVTQPITKADVEAFAETLNTTSRSIAAKLRNMGYAQETAGKAPSAFSDEATAALEAYLDANSGVSTYAEIAAAVFPAGEFTAKAVQGKVLSLDRTADVKPTPKAEVEKKYSDADEATVVSMIANGAFVEDIAAAVGKSVASVRGKALSLQRAGAIATMPSQRDVKGPPADALANIDVAASTVEEIAAASGHTVRGVKTMLTRRGLTAKDYDGAAKAAKNAA